MEKDFRLEKYKYVLEQKRRLNSNTFVVAAFYQGAIAALAAYQFSILRDFKNKDLDQELAHLGSASTLVISFLVTGISVILLISGMVSWWGYKVDEAELESEMELDCINPFRIWDLLKWYESYLVLSFLGIQILYTYLYFSLILPNLCVSASGS